MKATSNGNSNVVGPGLCETCRYAERISGARSTFWLCARSRTDPTFPRYPRLPVLQCRGYEDDPSIWRRAEPGAPGHR